MPADAHPPKRRKPRSLPHWHRPQRSRDFLTKKQTIVVVPNLRHHLSRVTILAQLTSDDVLDAAYEWLCRRRRDYSTNADVWSLRRR